MKQQARNDLLKIFFKATLKIHKTFFDFFVFFSSSFILLFISEKIFCNQTYICLHVHVYWHLMTQIYPSL